MASNPTTRNRLEKQGAGENANTWGAPKLNTVLDLTDAALDGWTVKALTGDVTLTSVNFATDEARPRVLKFTGAGPFTVTIPAVEKWYVVWNACTAAVTLTTGSGLTVAVETSEIALLICDGTNVRALGADAKSIKAYVDALVAASGGLPSQSGNSGKALTTNGTAASWGQLGASGIADGGISGIKLAAGAAVTNLGFTPANAAGQAFTGQVSVPALTHLRAGTRISLYDNTGGSNETTVYFNSLDDTRLAYDVPNGKLSWWVGGVKLFSVDVNGNAIFKGNVTAYATP